MADSTQKPPKKELSMEIRLLLAFILMGLVLFTTPYLYRSQTPARKTPAVPQTTATPATSAAAPQPTTEKTVEGAPAVAAGKEEDHTIETDLYRVVFSNRGALVRSWVLKKYRNLELVNKAGVQKAAFPFSLVFRDQKPSQDLNAVLYQASVLPGGLGIEYKYSNAGISSRKSFRFKQDSYLSEVSSELVESGKAIPHLLAWRGGFGDMAVPNAAGSQHSLHFDVTAGKLIVNDAKAARDKPVSATGNYSFAGLEDTYFAAVFLPNENVPVEIQTLSDTVPSPSNPKEEPHVGAAVGGEGSNDLPLFVGPKDIQILRSVNPKLEQAVDFGWFGFIAKPLFLAVHWLNDRWVHNYGWSIVLITIFINFALFPLKITSMKSSKKMQALQPQIAAINEKYKNIGIRDPRKADQNQEVMGLYKKHGVNPMGGCMPMVLQIPFLIAFYKVLSVSIEMRSAHWLWVTDLSQPETLAIRILPVAMIATQLLMQKMTPATGMDPSQQKMMLMMPLFMGFMFYGVSSGLVLYWLTSNLVGIAQQLFFNRTGAATEAAQSVQVKRKKNGKGSR